MSHFETLFHKFLTNTCTDAERQELMVLISQQQHTRELLALIDQTIATSGEELQLKDDSTREILSVILQTKAPAARRFRIRPFLWKAAAILLIVLGAGGTAFVLQMKQKAPVAMVPADLPPASYGAVLTLDNGKQVPLDSIQQGTIANHSGALVRLQHGTISYDQHTTAPAGMNSLTTSRGKLFHLVLPDSSEVWLNAASTLKYPTAFDGRERVVTLTGEAYFEVRQQMNKPFKVKTMNGAEVRVLGTGFNINAYTNEPAITTTLLHGSVQMAVYNSQALLKPGQQGTFSARISPAITVAQADTSYAIAWKHGIFNFENAGIQTVMKQLERWYDIDVVYENDIPDITFAGKMERNLTLRQVLRILEISNVHYRLEGKKLIISR